MNLIEKLGGYAQAKALIALPASTYDCGVKFNREELERAMLEHRRENNIFECGDKIVYRNEPILRSVVEVRTIKYVGDKSVWSYSKDKYNFATEVYLYQIRHATPEEIKAGHRL